MRCGASVAALNSLAARLRILERQDLNGVCKCDEQACIIADIIGAARRIHEIIDMKVGAVHHGPAAAIRSAGRVAGLPQHLTRRLLRVARAADVLRHVTRYSIAVVMQDLELSLAGDECSDPNEVPMGGSARASDDEGARDLAQHALGLAQLAVQGMDVALSRLPQDYPIPDGVPQFSMSESTEETHSGGGFRRGFTDAGVQTYHTMLNTAIVGTWEPIHVAVQTSACRLPRKGRVNGRAVQCSVASTHVATQVHTYSPEVADKSVACDLDWHNEGSNEEVAADVASGADVAPLLDWAAFEELLDMRESLGRKALGEEVT